MVSQSTFLLTVILHIFVMAPLDPLKESLEVVMYTRLVTDGDN